MLCQTVFLLLFFSPLFFLQVNHSEYLCLWQPDLDLGSYYNKCWLSAVNALKDMCHKTQKIMYQEGWNYCAAVIFSLLFFFSLPKPSHLPLFVELFTQPSVWK